jgi:hypothetical protein
MKLFSISVLASLFVTLSAQAESLSCISRDQPLGRGYEVDVKNETSLQVSLRGRVLLPWASVRKVSVPTVGGQSRTDYVTARAHLVVSPKTAGDDGYFSMVTLQGKGPIPLYCTRF